MRRKWILGIGFIVVIALLMMVYGVLATYDYNKFKPEIARMVKAATGRELRLGGEINLSLGLSPSLVAEDVALANAPWGSKPEMINIAKLKLQVRLLPLLRRDLEISQIGLSGGRVLLETGPDARHNWDFFTGKAAGGRGPMNPAEIEIGQLSIANLDFTFFRHQTKSKKQFRLASLTMNRQGTEDQLAFHLQGDFNGQPVALDGTIGSLHQLLKRERFPVQFEAKSSRVTVAINGAIDDIHALTGFDLLLDGSGQDLSEIEPFIGKKLPATDRFALKGRLTGAAKALSLEDAQGSARRGSLHFTVNGTVQDFFKLRGMDLQSNLTGKDFTEFGAVIGKKLPVTDHFEIQGRLTGAPDGFALQAATASAGRGRMHLSLTGAVKDLLTLKGLALQLRFSGEELTEVGPLLAVELPDLGAFDVQGKLTGSPQALSLNPLTAVIDKSDFKGQATAAFLTPPKFTVRLDSSVIDFTALMVSIEKDEHEPVEKEQLTRRLFSDTPLALDAFGTVDADILLRATNIHARNALFETGYLALKLEDQDLRIDKFEATYKGAKLSGNLHIERGQTPRVAADFLVQSFNLGDFLKETGKSDNVRAVIDIAAHGQSEGDSVKSLMANLDGEIGAVMGEGYLTRYLDMLSSGLSEQVIQFWDPPQDVDQIQCAVVQFDIKKGVAVSQAFVFNTRAGIIDGQGEINLGTEKINFFLVPKSKHPELGLKPSLKVSGTVMEPHVGVAKRSLLTSGAKGLSQFAVGPVGLLAPFAHLGAHNVHPCDVKGVGQSEPGIPAEEQAPSP